MKNDNQELIKSIKNIFGPLRSGVKRRAQGALKYDYIVPSGYYEEQWDWDGFFIGIALSSDIPTEAVFLKNWVLNFLINSRSDGYTPGCVTPKGRDERLNQMKPFISQGAYFASEFLNDYTWLKPYYNQLKKVVMYRQKNLWNKKYDLGVWFNSMESGADNNVAALDFPNKTVIATDLNSFMYREFYTLSRISNKLKKQKDAEYFKKRAQDVKENINKYLWDEKDHTYYNLDSRNGSFIRRNSYNCIHPLWAGIAPEHRAKKYIESYVLNPSELWTNFGIRCLSKKDSGYNNVNMIKPHSNWQGPVWPIANYFYMQALLNYGYQKEAIDLAKNISNTCMIDIKKTGGMHENYNAETGEPIAAANFIGWNLLVHNMLDEAVHRINPLKI